MGPTNKNPEVIAKYYLKAAKQSGGVPRKIRSDDGTENSVIEAIHTYLSLPTIMKMLAWDVLLLADPQQTKELKLIGHNL